MVDTLLYLMDHHSSEEATAEQHPSCPWAPGRLPLRVFLFYSTSCKSYGGPHGAFVYWITVKTENFINSLQNNAPTHYNHITIEVIAFSKLIYL